MGERLWPCGWVQDFRGLVDLAAITGAGISLSKALGAASAIYGPTFNGALSLKALTCFADGDLPSLPPALQAALRASASEVDLVRVPSMQPKAGVCGAKNESRSPGRGQTGCLVQAA